MASTTRVVRIWRDHVYERAQHIGVAGEAYPRWSDRDGGFVVHALGNERSASEVVSTSDDLWDKLIEGYGVRCIEPATGYRSILKGRFKAVIEQP